MSPNIISIKRSRGSKTKWIRVGWNRCVKHNLCWKKVHIYRHLLAENHRCCLQRITCESGEKKAFPFSVENERNLPFFHLATFNKTKEQHITFAPKFDHCCHDILHMRRRFSALSSPAQPWYGGGLELVRSPRSTCCFDLENGVRQLKVSSHSLLSNIKSQWCRDKISISLCP